MVKSSKSSGTGGRPVGHDHVVGRGRRREPSSSMMCSNAASVMPERSLSPARWRASMASSETSMIPLSSAPPRAGETASQRVDQLLRARWACARSRRRACGAWRAARRSRAASATEISTSGTAASAAWLLHLVADREAVAVGELHREHDEVRRRALGVVRRVGAVAVQEHLAPAALEGSRGARRRRQGRLRRSQPAARS